MMKTKALLMIVAAVCFGLTSSASAITWGTTLSVGAGEYAGGAGVNGDTMPVGGWTITGTVVDNAGAWDQGYNTILNIATGGYYDRTGMPVLVDNNEVFNITGGTFISQYLYAAYPASYISISGGSYTGFIEASGNVLGCTISGGTISGVTYSAGALGSAIEFVHDGGGFWYDVGGTDVLLANGTHLSLPFTVISKGNLADGTSFVGNSMEGKNSGAVIISPEPGTLAVLAIGGGLALLKRRRR